MTQLDTAKALKALGDNTSLYKRILSKFIEDYSASGTTLAAHLQAGEREEAERLAHTLKGLGGSIGALLLTEKAAVVEMALREGSGTAECLPAAHELTAALAQTIESCAVALRTLG